MKRNNYPSRINCNNLILSAGIGYKWNDLKIFIKSLRKVSNDRVIIIVDDNLDKTTKEKGPLGREVAFRLQGPFFKASLRDYFFPFFAAGELLFPWSCGTLAEHVAVDVLSLASVAVTVIV